MKENDDVKYCTQMNGYNFRKDHLDIIVDYVKKLASGTDT